MKVLDLSQIHPDVLRLSSVVMESNHDLWNHEPAKSWVVIVRHVTTETRSRPLCTQEEARAVARQALAEIELVCIVSPHPPW